MPRNDGPNAIAKNEADDHAYHKLHCLYPVRAKRKGQADALSQPTWP